MMKWVQRLKRIDPILATCVTLLVASGIIGIASTTTRGAVDQGLIRTQLIALGIGLIGFFLMTTLSTEVVNRWTYPLYGILVLALVAVLFTDPIRGTRGWFSLGPVQIQPAELGKLIILFVLAKYMAVVASRTSRFQFIWVSGLLLALPVLLIIRQPDLGTALVYVVCWGGLLLLSGLKKKFVIGLFVAASVVAVGAWTVALQEYQKARIVSFLDPSQDPLGQGYNLIQSKIAVGSGQWIGRGLGHGSQSQLRFLPEQHTDFIFAVLAEELGLIGSGLLLVVYGGLLWRGVVIARRATSDFGVMLASGVVIMLGYQSVINIGMNMGLFPVTGVPLPFVSYGGTSLMTSFLLLGVLQLVAQEGRIPGSVYADPA